MINKLDNLFAHGVFTYQLELYAKPTTFGDMDGDFILWFGEIGLVPISPQNFLEKWLETLYYSNKPLQQDTYNSY